MSPEPDPRVDRAARGIAGSAWHTTTTDGKHSLWRSDARDALDAVGPVVVVKGVDLTAEEREAVRQFISYEPTMAHDDPKRYWALIESARRKLEAHDA